jgi:hypothetical protein
MSTMTTSADTFSQLMDKIEVLPVGNILPHHLWIGVQHKAH